MKAIVIERPGGPEVLRLVETEKPSPGPDEILVQVEATAVNRADLLQRKGLYPAPPGVRADIPGLEFAGEVESAPSTSRWRAGDRVMGLLAGGGYAERVCLHQDLAIHVPDNLSWIEAAGVPEVFFTAYDALFPKLGIRRGERLLIHAVASGVGTAALQMAKRAGLEVFGTAGSDHKLAVAGGFGLDHGINRHREDFAREVLAGTGGVGVDAILDVVGAEYWERNLAALASRGRLILVGLMGGSKVEADLGAILRKRLTVIGTVLRSRPLEEKLALAEGFRRDILPGLAEGTLKPVIDQVLPLREASRAHEIMEANKNAGKIVLKVS